MIAVDTSILVGLILAEDDIERLRPVLREERVAICASAVVEARIWAARNLATRQSPWLEGVLRRPNVRLDDFTPAMADAAADAFRRFGRGSGHPAALNFGDALVYGHAAVAGLPLLCKGADFRLTDLALDARAPA